MLRIPNCARTHFPEGLIERRSRADRAVAAAVAESWTNGISTRRWSGLPGRWA
ncbi:MAG: transposase [Collinsella aerofaciens]